MSSSGGCVNPHEPTPTWLAVRFLNSRNTQARNKRPDALQAVGFPMRVEGCPLWSTLGGNVPKIQPRPRELAGGADPKVGTRVQKKQCLRGRLILLGAAALATCPSRQKGKAPRTCGTQPIWGMRHRASAMCARAGERET